MRHRAGLCLVATLLVAGLHTHPTAAGPADVLSVKVDCGADSRCRFRVTVRHDDEGWSHYANRWEVLSEDGRLLASRVLAHPHVSEQPFERSLAGVEIPAGLRRVRVRARDMVHGYGGAEVVVDLPERAESPGTSPKGEGSPSREG